MTRTVRTWLSISHHTAFRVGGWAFVREDAGALTGWAGGERRIDAERAALLGLIAALRGLEGASKTRLHTASAQAAAIPARIKAAEAGDNVPTENLDLWAAAKTALAAAKVEIVRDTAAPGTPAAFTAGWAEFARDKAKAGTFTHAIPKPNLAKAGVKAGA